MTDYRRNRVPGGTYFFTVNLHDRRLTLLTDHIESLRAAIRKTRARLPFHIDAWVVLPDHAHSLWTLPEGDSNFATRWQIIKAEFSRTIPKSEPRSASRTAKAERGIWQRRFWEHSIRDDTDYAAHMDYIHLNPVKHGHAPHRRRVVPLRLSPRRHPQPLPTKLAPHRIDGSPLRPIDLTAPPNRAHSLGSCAPARKSPDLDQVSMESRISAIVLESAIVLADVDKTQLVMAGALLA